MVIEYTAKPRDIAALYSYARKHSIKVALLFYGLPMAMAVLFLAKIRALTHSLTLADWMIALILGAVFFILFPLILRLRTKKEKEQAHSIDSARKAFDSNRQTQR